MINLKYSFFASLRRLAGLLMLILLVNASWAQENENKGLLNLKRSEESKLNFVLMSQFWVRHTDLNPSTTINDKAQDQFTDISIRRVRMAMTAYLNKNWYFKFQMGVNNVNHLKTSAQLNILDLETFYKFSDGLILGGGKNGHVGLSRYASPGSFSALGFDLAFFAMPTVGISDEILRKLSAYAKGDLGKFAYRTVFARPSIRISEPDVTYQANFQSNLPNIQYSGYLAYQFFEKENITSAFRRATYHSRKKVLNLGAGFMYQEDALSGLNATADTVDYDMSHLAVDIFMDLPFGVDNKQAITWYLGYFDYDFGRNYVRNAGVNNPANGTEVPTFQGSGNKFPTTGTGQIIYSHIGYFSKTDRLKSMEGIQPFAGIQYADYEALADPMVVLDAGLQFIFDGHNSKVTLGVQDRPIYESDANGDLNQEDRKQMWVLQYQVKIRG